MRINAYSASISDSYNFIVAFLITVPFPARNIGFSLLVTKIISLKIRLNVGASLLASSTFLLSTWVWLLSTRAVSKRKPRNAPNHISKLGDLLIVRHVDCILWPGFHKNPCLTSPPSKHAQAR